MNIDDGLTTAHMTYAKAVEYEIFFLFFIFHNGWVEIWPSQISFLNIVFIIYNKNVAWNVQPE